MAHFFLIMLKRISHIDLYKSRTPGAEENTAELHDLVERDEDEAMTEKKENKMKKNY